MGVGVDGERRPDLTELDPELLANFTSQRSLVRLARLDLAAGQVEAVTTSRPDGEQPLTLDRQPADGIQAVRRLDAVGSLHFRDGCEYDPAKRRNASAESTTPSDIDKAVVDVAVSAHHSQLLSKRGEEPVDVEECRRLLVQAELSPGERLEELLQRARAARHRDECVREVGHPRLALMHVRDDVQPCQRPMGDLSIDEMLWHHTHDLAAGSQSRVRDRAHQPHSPAAVDDADPAARQRLGERRRGQAVRRRPRRRARKDRYPHAVILLVTRRLS